MMHTVHHLVHQYGYGFITLAVFLECSGLLVPGETVFFGSAVYAATTGKLNIVLVILAAMAGAIAGNLVAFAIGRLLGKRLLSRYGWRVGLTERRLAIGRYLFRRHGGKVVFFSRFVSVLRSFGAVFAGANEMPLPSFLAWTVAGGIAWPAAHGLFAYAVGGATRRLPVWLQIGLGILAVVAIVLAIRWVKRNQMLLEDAAMRSEEQEGHG